MEREYLLWLYVISAGWTLSLCLRNRGLFAPRFVVSVVATGLAAALALSRPEHAVAGFVVATAGFLLFLMLPGLLVRVARALAARGRFGAAYRFVAIARLLLPAQFLRMERDLYRQASTGHGREALLRRLRSRSAGPESAGSRVVTRALVVAFIAMYAACLVRGGFGGASSLLTLVGLGANEFSRVASGEWFRLFTAMFLHVGLLHLGMNVFAVLLVGGWVEPDLGPYRTLLVFLLGGLLGNLASVALYGGGADPYVSAGASGGAMALFGATLVVALRAPASPARARRVQSLAVIVGATIFLGVVEEGIDNGAHLGGLAAGAMIALVLTGSRAPRRAVVRPVAFLLLAAVGASFAWMLTALPGWSATREFEEPAYRFTGPAFLAPGEEGWEAGVLGDVEIEVRETGETPAETLARELFDLVVAARDLPGAGKLRSTGPEAHGRWVAGSIRWDGDAPWPPVRVYVRRDGESGRTAVVRVRPGEDDPELTSRLLSPLLPSFRFE